MAVGAHQDGNICRTLSFIDEFAYLFDQHGENLFLIVFLGQKRDVDETVGFAILRSLLSDVGVGFLQLFGTLRIVLLLFEIRLLGGFDEESIVEIDDFSI